MGKPTGNSGKQSNSPIISLIKMITQILSAYWPLSMHKNLFWISTNSKASSKYSQILSIKEVEKDSTWKTLYGAIASWPMELL